MQSVTSPSSGLPFDATPPGYLGTFVGPAPAPPITGPALPKYWVLDTAYTAFRFRLQEGNFWKVHVTQLGMNLPIISEDIGATVS
ncbi:hypothetical protein N7453_003937 [Penicillium expansum]|nr:hypothetical protein N7453_003937 [Penicillium expansum]